MLDWKIDGSATPASVCGEDGQCISFHQVAGWLLRQYVPKGTDLSRWTAEEINAVAHTLNSRPRKLSAGRLPPKPSTNIVSSERGWIQAYALASGGPRGREGRHAADQPGTPPPAGLAWVFRDDHQGASFVGV
jgi:hypothetical protein